MLQDIGYYSKKLFKCCIILTAFLFFLCCIKINLLPNNNKIYHKRENTLLNIRDFHYIISNDVCILDNDLVIILIHSTPNHFRHRNLIRNTWGNPESNLFLRVRVVFLLASAPQFQEDIEKENVEHKDIVQGNFIDSYRNLTYKHAMGLKWVSEHCANAKYVIKMDDDIFIDIYQFIEYIHEHFTHLELENNLACLVHSRMHVIRDPSNKWYVSKKEYAPKFFVEYCSGMAYLTTVDVARKLFLSAQELDYFWIDDVHITGNAAKVANISHTKLNFLYDMASDGLRNWSNSMEDLKWNKMFAIHWADFELSQKAYIKTLKCWDVNCTCCYGTKTTPRPTQATTTGKVVA